MEQLLEIMLGHLPGLNLNVFEVNLQLRLQRYVLSVKFLVVVEQLPEEPIFLHDLDVVSGLLPHAHNSKQLVSVLVFLPQELLAVRNYSGLVHELLVLSFLVREFLLNDGIELFIGQVFSLWLLLNSDGSLGSLLPLLKIVFVKFRKPSDVGLGEFVDVLLWNYDKDCDEHIDALVSVDK